MNSRFIEMFKCALPGKEVKYSIIAEAATRVGYIVDENCATEAVLRFLREQPLNHNSTFYKTWSDVLDKHPLDLILDQLKHYASTYGTNQNSITLQSITTGTVDIPYAENTEVFIPNKDPIKIEWKKFKVIKAATVEEIQERVMNMFTSGSAMSSDTIQLCLDFLQEYNCLDSLNIDEIKNKEVQALIAIKTHKYPKDEFGLLRVIMYTYTGEALLIKSKDVIHAIKNPNTIFDFAVLSDQQLKQLSRIFLRYKPLFLAMKPHRDNAKYINKIRRLAVKNHTPLKKGFWEDCMLVTSEDDKFNKLKTATETVSELNNFRKVQIMQSIMSRINGKNLQGRMYIIRNGKSFIRSEYQPKVNQSYLMDLYAIVKKALVESLKEKASTFTVSDCVHIACPTSEKNFVGNYPIGTSVEFGESDNVLGIYWRNEWGCRDFDLHVITEDGTHVGWCSAYKTQNIIYSGDMTDANPEACELIYFEKGVIDGFVNLNKYNGGIESKYELFVAKENMTNKLQDTPSRSSEHNHYTKVMVNPNNIVFKASMTFMDGGQQTIAYLHNDRLYMMNVHTGEYRVSRVSEGNDIIQQTNKLKADSYIDLIPILIEAGFTKVQEQTTIVEQPKPVTTIDIEGLSKEEALKKVEESYKEKDVETKKQEKVEVEYDFTNPTKDMFLKLFA